MKKSSVKLFVENCKNSQSQAKSSKKVVATAVPAPADPAEILGAMPPQARRIMEKSIALGERPAWSTLATCVLENTPKKSMPLQALYQAVGAGIGEAVYACKNDRAAIRGSLYQAKNITHGNGIISLAEPPAQKAQKAQKAPIAAKKAAPAPAPAPAPAASLSTEDLLKILSCRLGK